MSSRVDKRPNAIDDLDRAADFIQTQSGSSRAIRFLREAEATFTQLARMPGIGTRYDVQLGVPLEVRFFPIHRHRKFLVSYRITTEGIEVLRILHGARDIQEVIGKDLGGDKNDPTD